MIKVIRNTVFTTVVLALTSLALVWNRDISQTRRQLSVERAVLASQNLDEAQKPTFPLELKFDKPVVRLGQFQELTVKTVPDAELDIVTIYPTGSFNNNQTVQVQASSIGEYQLRFKLDDFRHLGLFQTTVIARSGSQSAEATARFVLQSWTKDNQSVSTTDYTYPLVP